VFKITSFIIILLIGVQPAYSEDVILGQIYEIDEPNLLDWIKSRLAKLEQSGDLAKMQEEWKDTARKRVSRPKPVEGLSKAVKESVHLIDPSFVVDKAVIDHEGRMIAAPGMRINPLDTVNMSNHLIFIDGDDLAQVKWASDMYVRYKTYVKTILVNGNPIKTMEKVKFRVYFDQGGVLSRKFELKSVPSIVSQEGKRLRVASIVVD